MGDAAVLDEPINSAGVAFKVLGNLFQGQNLTERSGGWRSSIVTLFHDFFILTTLIYVSFQGELMPALTILDRLGSFFGKTVELMACGSHQSGQLSCERVQLGFYLRRQPLRLPANNN